MADINIAFCRAMLKAILEDLTVAELRDYHANSWVHCLNKERGEWEFHWPNRGRLSKVQQSTSASHEAKLKRDPFYFYDHCDNAYDCRANALYQWLAHYAPEQRKER